MISLRPSCSRQVYRDRRRVYDYVFLGANRYGVSRSVWIANRGDLLRVILVDVESDEWNWVTFASGPPSPGRNERNEWVHDSEMRRIYV